MISSMFRGERLISLPEIGSESLMSISLEKEQAGSGIEVFTSAAEQSKKREKPTLPVVEYVFVDNDDTMIMGGREFTNPLIDGLVELGIPEEIAMHYVLMDRGALAHTILDKVLRDSRVRSLNLDIKKKDKDRMAARVRKRRLKFMGDAYEEVPGVLEQLKAEGYKLIVTSNGDRDAIFKKLRRAKLKRELFSLVIGGDSGDDDEFFEKGEKHYAYASHELTGDESLTFSRFKERSVHVDDSPSVIESIIGTGVYPIGCARRDKGLRRRFNELDVPVVDDFVELAMLLRRLNTPRRLPDPIPQEDPHILLR